MKFSTVACVLGLGAVASAEVFLEETFDDGDAWTERWTVSNYREDLGKVELSAGKWFADEKLVGLRTTEDYRFYALATSLKKPFNNTDKDFVAQFSVKHEQKIDCGGGYLKFYPSKFDAKTFNGDSEYNIMFGPDLCGSKNLVHVIFNYKGTNHNYKKTITAPTDTLTHVYTLIVKPDQTYSVLIDGEEKGAGSLIEDWDILPPQKIKDPQASKPADWVEEPRIVDPEDKKPEGYDDILEFIPDPDAVKPEDWDDDMDGEWEAPSISNPEYLGPWTPKMIENSAYLGPWVHPEIDNPDYFVDDKVYVYETANVGLDVWQVKSGTIFDDILITDDIAYAEAFRKRTWEDFKEAEEKAFEAHEEAVKKAAEEEAKLNAPSEAEPEAEVEAEVEAEAEAEVDAEGEDVVADEPSAPVEAEVPIKDEL